VILINPKLLLCSVIFTQNQRFLGDFFNSISKLNTSNYDFLIINENVDLLKYKELLPKKTIILEAKGTPIENRIQSIHFAKEFGYEYILWQDCDDICESDRITSIINNLNDTDILVHDMKIVDEFGNKITEEFIGSRYYYKDKITIKDLLYLNFIGFGNMVLRLNCVPPNIYIPSSIRAIDWWIISILALQGVHITYLSKPLVKYRQHGQNIASLDYSDINKFKVQLGILYEHYKNLINTELDLGSIHFDIMLHLRKIERLRNRSWSNELYAKICNNIIQLKGTKNYLWWEKTNKIIKEVVIDG